MHGKQNFEKPKNLGRALGDLAAYCKKEAALIWAAVALAVFGAVLTIVGPNQISKITDTIIAGITGVIDMSAIGKTGVLLVVIYGASALFTYLQGYIMATVTQKVSLRMRRDISGKINRIPLKYFAVNTYGDVLSRVTNDVDTLGQSLGNSLAGMAAALAQFLGCLVMMIATNWIMAAAAVGSTLLGVVLMALIVTRSQKYFVARQKNLGSLNGYIEEIYAGHDVIRLSGAEEKVRARFDGMNKGVRDANLRSQFLSGLMQPIMVFIGNLGYVAVCVTGALLTIDGKITFGVITAFMIYVRLFSGPLQQISQGMTQIQSASAAAERVFDFLREEELPDDGEKSAPEAPCRGEVEFRHVKFAYPDQPDREVIHDLSFRVLPGEKVAIVGPTGAGKTTLVNLLMRFFDVTGGDILIDGTELADLPRSFVHSRFGMVLQDTWLFEGTVRENLMYNLKDVSEETMFRACRACGMDRFIRALPKGYDTVLDDNTSISAGQKQLLTIARAMIQNNPMLILDEATSSVDTRTELLTQRAMDQLSKKRTSFVIAHRLSTIKNADIILVVNHGDIVEQGSHEELLAKGGFYAELYNSQFEEAG